MTQPSLLPPPEAPARAGFTFTVPGVPVAKQHHKTRIVTPKGGRPAFVHQYPDPATVRFEERVRLCAINAGVRVVEGPVRLVVEFLWPMKGSPRKRDPRPRVRKTTRPDTSNALKAIEDGLNGVAYIDDAQVCSVVAEKWHAAQGEGPCVTVTITPLDGAGG